MSESFQRLLTLAGPEAQSLNAQAALGEVLPPERSQFMHLLRHFLARFFNHESASASGDAKPRLVQMAFAAGLPPLIVAIYLWPVYHRLLGWPPGGSYVGAPPYWAQVNHHFFFVVYSFAAVGIATIFEWDMFFPDLTDLFVLTTLPIRESRLFTARVAAIAVLLSAVLVDTCFLAPLVLPLATDPPSAGRMVAAHAAAVLAAGVFSAAFVLAFQSVVLAVFGERVFRRIALLGQGLMIALLTLLLLLFPVLSGVTPAMLQSGNRAVLLFPPYWFLGIFQSILEGGASQAIFAELAWYGVCATVAVVVVAIVAYPVAYVRRTRQLLLGTPLRVRRGALAHALDAAVRMVVTRDSVGRAVFHFIGQTLLRVPRYRIYLVLYGGVGLASVAATVCRLHVEQRRVQASIDADGVGMAIGLMTFWILVGLRTAFDSSGNRQGLWIWRTIHGDPPPLRVLLETARATQRWAMSCALGLSFAALAVLSLCEASDTMTPLRVAARFALAAAFCVLLTDLIFLRGDTVPFTGAGAARQENLALSVLGYFTVLPVVMALSLACEQWMEADIRNFGIAAVVALVAHLWLRKMQREHLRVCSEQRERDEEDDPMMTRLGLYR